MKNILLIYRGRVFDTEIKPRLDEFKNDNVFLIVENELSVNIVKYLIEDLTQKITLLTINEFLNYNIITKSMKFKAAVGNPPYQNNKSESDAGKLYIDITKKTMDILDYDGIVDYHTPETIVRDGRNKFTVKKKGLRSVDYTANESFNEGVTIINWIYDKSYDEDEVEVTNKDRSVDVRKYTDSLVDKNDKVLINLFEKLKENPTKLFTSDQQVNTNQEKKDSIYKYKVYMNYYKDKIKYSKPIPKFFGKKKISISISKGYTKENFLISKKDFGQLHLMIDISGLNDIQLQNIKSFLFNEISINICNKYKKLYGTGFNNMLYVFPKIDYNVNYTNSEVAKVFGLSTNDIVEILK